MSLASSSFHTSPTNGFFKGVHHNDGSTVMSCLSSTASTAPSLRSEVSGMYDRSSLLHLRGKFQQVVQKVVKTNRYHGKDYPNCFVGSEAVTALIQAGVCRTRKQAVTLGRDLAKTYNLFDHVCQDHIFKDRFLFYRFNNGNLKPGKRRHSSTSPSRSRTTKAMMNPSQIPLSTVAVFPEPRVVNRGRPGLNRANSMRSATSGGGMRLMSSGAAAPRPGNKKIAPILGGGGLSHSEHRPHGCKSHKKVDHEFDSECFSVSSFSSTLSF